MVDILFQSSVIHSVLSEDKFSSFLRVITACLYPVSLYLLTHTGSSLCIRWEATWIDNMTFII